MNNEDRMESDMYNLQAALDKIVSDPRPATEETGFHHPAIDSIIAEMIERGLDARFVFWMGYFAGEAGYEFEKCDCCAHKLNPTHN